METLSSKDIKRVRLKTANVAYTAKTAVKKVIFNGVTIYEDESIYFTLSEPFYMQESIYYSVDPNTTWANFIDGNFILESEYGGECGLSNGNHVVYKLPETDGRYDTIDYWVCDYNEGTGEYKRVTDTDLIKATEYTLLLRAKTIATKSGEIIVNLGINDLEVSSEGMLCIFTASETGEYLVYSTSENADIGREMNGEFEYFEVLPYKVSLTEGEELRVLCATKNWQNDNYDLIIIINK
jgi:hypothetical protein